MLRRFEEFSFAISEIYHNIQKIERDEMDKYGLKGPHAQYLIAMIRCPEGITAAQLSELCDKDKAAVSRALSELEKRGLVIRELANDTAYRALLKLTETGNAAARFVCEKVTQAVEIAGRGLSDEERQLFYRVLHRIGSNLQTIAKDGLPELHKA
jgi:DNA-binding MarR family transcriptional regulator